MRLFGRRIRAPEIQCAKIRLGGEGREVDAVCTAAYRADDGEEATVLANATWCEQTVEMTWGGIRRSIVIAPGGIELVDRRRMREERSKTTLQRNRLK